MIRPLASLHRLARMHYLESRSSVRVTPALAVVLCSACAATSNTATYPEADPPNILLIVSDDQGYADFGAYRGAADVRTPNLDRLAGLGTRFMNAYVTASVCSPSRAALLTGRYPQRWGSSGGYRTSMPADQITLAELLRDAGYATGMIGKAHYGELGGADSPHFPLNHGFDSFYGRVAHTIDYVRHTEEAARIYTPEMAAQLGVGQFWDDDRLVEPEGYSTDLFTERAVSFVGENRDRPFFLMLSYNEVHLFIHQLTDEQLAEHDLDHVPDWRPDADPTFDEYLEWYVRTVGPHSTPRGRERYLIHLAELDRSVGTVLDALAANGVADNTLIVYLSDNGGAPRNYSSNVPLTGSKYNLGEGGIRVPFVIAWPRRLQERAVSDEIVSALDVFATVAAAAGVELPADREYDGVNLLPYLAGDRDGVDRETLYWSGHELTSAPPDTVAGSPVAFLHRTRGDTDGWAIRDGDWKLRYFGQADRFGLYNLVRDVAERNNLAGRMPDRVAELEQKWRAWNREVSPASEPADITAAPER